MKKYKFRLEPILGIKAKKLDEKRLELAEIQKILTNEIHEKNEIINNKEKANDYLIKLYSGEKEFNISEIQTYKDYIARMAVNILQKEERIKQIEIFLKAKQMEVNEALKEKKVLEKLKEKEQEKYIKEIYFQEAKELDDIISCRYKKAVS